MRKQTLSDKQSMSQYIWHSMAIIYKPALDVQKAHRLSSRIHLGNKPTLANKIQAGPAHTLFAHQLRTHRSNTHSFLQELLVFIFGLESQTFSIQDTSPLNQSEQGDHSGLGINR